MFLFLLSRLFVFFFFLFVLSFVFCNCLFYFVSFWRGERRFQWGFVFLKIRQRFDFMLDLSVPNRYVKDVNSQVIFL